MTISLVSKIPRRMKIFFHPVEAWGHINASIGVAQIMQRRGHQIVFLISKKVFGQFRKYGFEERCLDDDEDDDDEDEDEEEDEDVIDDDREEGERGKKSSVNKSISGMNEACSVDCLIQSELFVESEPLKKYGMFQKIFEINRFEILKRDKKLKRLIYNEKPDLILIDQILISPIILHCGIPWCLIFSCNPISFRNDHRLPPPFSGLPTDDQTLWKIYRENFQKKYQNCVQYNQNKLLTHYGFEKIYYDGISPPSPYLNIYGFPEELDYTDIAPMPLNCYRLDTFCRNEPDRFELPKIFLENLQKNSKLIYISLGTLASIRFDLIKKILNILSSTNKFGLIVSKGQFNDGFEFDSNIFGANHLPQTKIIPLIDLVITHGGNNTVTETLKFGKPMLVMPFFVDQYDNAQRLVEKGFGLKLDPFNFNPDDLIESIEILLNDQLLKKRLEKISKRILIKNSDMNDRLADNLETIVQLSSSTSSSPAPSTPLSPKPFPSSSSSSSSPAPSTPLSPKTFPSSTSSSLSFDKFI